MEAATGQRDDTICRKRLIGCLHPLDLENSTQVKASIYNLWDPGFSADISDMSGSLGEYA